MHRYALLLALFNAVLAMPADHEVMRSQPSNMDKFNNLFRMIDKHSWKACPENSGKSKLTEDEKQHFLKIHNSYRAKENANLPNMRWDESLAHQAQKLIDLQPSCRMQHKLGQSCGDTRFGQNVDEDSSSCSNMLAEKVVKKWYKEKSDYNLITKKCNCGAVCRHYTQVVWRGNTILGCAARNCGQNHTVVCNYVQTGNWDTLGPHDYGNTW